MTSRRWMALCFALGSGCFLVGPFPGYAQLVGASAVGVTFFVGSILFTLGGGVQSVLAWPERRFPGGGRAGGAAVVQSAGTLFFNATTFQAMHTALTNSDYNRLVWRPDWRGSICFLVRARSHTARRHAVAGRDGCRFAGARAGGSLPSTSSAASSSESRPSPATSFRRPARCSTRLRQTGTPRWAPPASWPARSTRCTATRRRRCPFVADYTSSSTNSRATCGASPETCHGCDSAKLASLVRAPYRTTRESLARAGFLLAYSPSRVDHRQSVRGRQTPSGSAGRVRIPPQKSKNSAACGLFLAQTLAHMRQRT
jgi:hypothetical protein